MLNFFFYHLFVYEDNDIYYFYVFVLPNKDDLFEQNDAFYGNIYLNNDLFPLFYEYHCFDFLLENDHIEQFFQYLFLIPNNNNVVLKLQYDNIFLDHKIHCFR